MAGMSSDYTGDPTATQAPSPPPGRAVEPIVRRPTDGDALSAASVEQDFKVLADFAAWLTNHAAILDDGTTNTFTGTIAGSAPAATRLRTLRIAYPCDNGSAIWARLYTVNDAGGVASSWEFTINAEWLDADDAGGDVWQSDDSLVVSLSVRARADSMLIRRMTSGAPTWADGAWTNSTTIDTNLSSPGSVTGATGLVATAGGVTATAGNIAASAGNVTASAAVSAGTTVTAGTGLIATTGGLLVSAGGANITGGATIATGDHTISAGDQIVTAGKVTVSGTVAGDSGDGIVKSKRYYSTGTALVAGDFALPAGWGAGAAVSVLGGCDGDFRIKVTAGTGPTADPYIDMTFKDLTWTSTPIFEVRMVSTDDAQTLAGIWTEFDPVVNVSTTTARWYTKKTLGFTPVDTKVYWFVGRVRGI
jgi:hypothetical protein